MTCGMEESEGKFPPLLINSVDENQKGRKKREKEKERRGEGKLRRKREKWEEKGKGKFFLSSESQSSIV